MTSYHIDGLVQDCSNSIALAMELLWSCAKPSRWNMTLTNAGDRSEYELMKDLHRGTMECRLWVYKKMCVLWSASTENVSVVTCK